VEWSWFVDFSRAAVVTVRTMFTAALTTMTALEVVLFGKDDEAFFAVIKVPGF
jgi:hypothetical protein